MKILTLLVVFGICLSVANKAKSPNDSHCEMWWDEPYGMFTNKASFDFYAGRLNAALMAPETDTLMKVKIQSIIDSACFVATEAHYASK